MTEIKPRNACHQCGAKLPDQNPQGRCPSCLMQLALDASPPPEVDGDSGPPSPEELESQLADIQVVRLLGVGGMGAVYLARQINLGRMVAIKLLNPQRAHDPVLEERFLREARALAMLHHPHIVLLYDVGRVSNTHYIMMEYVDGANLREVISDGKLSPAEALRLIPQICDAMQYAHDRGIVHRDIKPENILIDQQGQVKIADFGLVKLMGAASNDAITLTDSGSRMGTQGYMAPEQTNSTDMVDHRADIYSLGIIFYELLTGKRPTPDYTPPSRISEVDPRVDRVIEYSLKERPQERFQQVSMIKEAIERISRSRSAWPKIALALGIGCVCLLASWYGFTRFPSRTPERQQSLEAISSPFPLVSPFSDTTARAQQQIWAEENQLPVTITNGLDQRFHFIPHGEFTVEPGFVARITKPFYLGETEVTVGVFRAFVQDTGYQTDAEKSGQGGWIHTPGSKQRIESHPEYIWSHELFASDDALPVTMVTIPDIEAFIAWLSQRENRMYRLPTYAEWFWASQAGNPNRLQPSDPSALSDLGWHSSNSGNRSQPVAKKQKNPWGLFDVFGNAMEFVQDGLNLEMPQGTFDDPKNPLYLDRRAGCGGSFADPARYIVHDLNSSFPMYSVGFRLLLEPPAESASQP